MRIVSPLSVLVSAGGRATVTDLRELAEPLPVETAIREVREAGDAAGLQDAARAARRRIEEQVKTQGERIPEVESIPAAKRTGKPIEAGTYVRISATGAEGTVVELSWFGDAGTTLALGGVFHSRRLTVRASQVGTVAASRRGRRARQTSSSGRKKRNARTRIWSLT